MHAHTCTHTHTHTHTYILTHKNLSIIYIVIYRNTLKERSVEMDDKLATEGTLCLEVHQRSASNPFLTDCSLPDEDHQLKHSESMAEESMKMVIKHIYFMPF